MTDITTWRLADQQISGTKLTTPADIVAHMVAMQAQDYQGALWGVGLRLPGSTKSDIEQAVADRSIIRTWPMRGTLHFVAAADVRWILALLAPRILTATAGRRKALEIDDGVLAKARKALTAALEGKNELTRDQMYKVLTKSGIDPAGQRGIHIFRHLSQEALLCYGLHAEKQPTFGLLDEFVAPTPEKSPDEAVAELTRRYFTSHGPAQLSDFVWWSGLKMSDAKAGLAACKSDLASETIGDKTYWTGRGAKISKSDSVYLLPGFDEYMLGYRDRSAALPVKYTDRIVPGGNGMFLSTIVVNGQVRGTWKKSVRKSEVVLTPEYFDPKIRIDRAALAPALKRYGEFVGLAAKI